MRRALPPCPRPGPPSAALRWWLTAPHALALAIRSAMQGMLNGGELPEHMDMEQMMAGMGGMGGMAGDRMPALEGRDWDDYKVTAMEDADVGKTFDCTGGKGEMMKTLLEAGQRDDFDNPTDLWEVRSARGGASEGERVLSAWRPAHRLFLAGRRLCGLETPPFPPQSRTFAHTLPQRAPPSFPLESQAHQHESHTHTHTFPQPPPAPI